MLSLCWNWTPAYAALTAHDLHNLPLSRVLRGKQLSAAGNSGSDGGGGVGLFTNDGGGEEEGGGLQLNPLEPKGLNCLV